MAVAIVEDEALPFLRLQLLVEPIGDKGTIDGPEVGPRMSAVLLDDEFYRDAHLFHLRGEDFRLLQWNDEILIAVDEKGGRALFRDVRDRRHLPQDFAFLRVVGYADIRPHLRIELLEIERGAMIRERTEIASLELARPSIVQQISERKETGDRLQTAGSAFDWIG